MLSENLLEIVAYMANSHRRMYPSTSRLDSGNLGQKYEPRGVVQVSRSPPIERASTALRYLSCMHSGRISGGGLAGGRNTTEFTMDRMHGAVYEVPNTRRAEP